MFHADFPGFTLKIVEHSRYLLLLEGVAAHEQLFGEKPGLLLPSR